MASNPRSAAFGQGLPPAGGWKLAMPEDPTEYSPEFQDEYRSLWHEAAAERDRYRSALADAASGRDRDVIDLLWVARQSLIDHAAQLPLKRRDHGPVLVRIDAMIERLATDGD